jgi:hypothetical protein
MPNFKYIGSRTKANGKVDVKLPRCYHGAVPINVVDAVPNVTIVAVTDPCHADMLRRHRDVTKKPAEAVFSEQL